MQRSRPQLIKQCESCQLHQPKPVAAPLHPWQWPLEPWSRLHIDYAGQVHGEMFLIVVDAHSKWVLRTRKHATSEVTVEKQRELFSVHGLPETIVSDNGPSFTGS